MASFIKATVYVPLIELAMVDWDIMDLCYKMEWIYVTIKMINTSSECWASLADKERREDRRRKFNIYHRLVQDADNHFQTYNMYTSREWHIDSYGKAKKKCTQNELLVFLYECPSHLYLQSLLTLYARFSQMKQVGKSFVPGKAISYYWCDKSIQNFYSASNYG